MCSSYRGELAIILGVKGLRFSDYQFNISVAFLNISDQFRSECYFKIVSGSLVVIQGKGLNHVKELSLTLTMLYLKF